MSVEPFVLRYYRHVAKSRTMNGSFPMKQCRDCSSIQLLVRELAKMFALVAPSLDSLKLL